MHSPMAGITTQCQGWFASVVSFGRTPFFTPSEFQEMGYKMVIWPVSSLRVVAKAQE